jgi:hypothetical protein
VLSAVLRDLARFREISVVIFVVILNQGISGAMRELVREIASQVRAVRDVCGRLAFHRAFMRVAVM